MLRAAGQDAGGDAGVPGCPDHAGCRGAERGGIQLPRGCPSGVDRSAGPTKSTSTPGMAAISSTLSRAPRVSIWTMPAIVSLTWSADRPSAPKRRARL